MSGTTGGGLWRRFEAIAARQADAPALICPEREVSFAQLQEAALSAAAELSRHGLKPGSRCLFWSANSPELAASVLAAWRLGAIIVLVNDEAPVAHLINAAKVTSPTVTLVDASRVEAAADALSGTVLALPDGRTAPIWADSATPINDAEPASILFTSGSTGLPKGVTQSHANLLAGSAMVAEHLGLRPDDRILCPIPWSFDYGFGQFLSMVTLGFGLVSPSGRNPIAICHAIATCRPTVFAGLPSVFAMLLRGVSPVRETDLGSLRLVTSTGGKIAPAIFADVLAIFRHCAISLNYGMTETYRSAGLPVALAAERPDCVGAPYPGVSIAVVRDDGSEAAPGEVGEIVHRGVGVFLGYWRAPEATARVRRPDPLWVHGELPAPMAVFSGDLGWKDAEGFLYVKGRRDRLIKSMGVRVSPDEIETLIRGSGLVRDVAVIGAPNELMGEMVIAAITLADGAEHQARELKAFARRTMSPHMQPREYHVVEAFPLTPNGKLDLIALRGLLVAEPA